MDSSSAFYILVRHGERADEVAEYCNNPDDPNLTTHGFEFSHEVGTYIGTFLSSKASHIDDIIFISSPLLRAVQTAQSIRNGLIEFTDGKKEHQELNSLIKDTSISIEDAFMEKTCGTKQSQVSRLTIEASPTYFATLSPDIPFKRNLFVDYELNKDLLMNHLLDSQLEEIRTRERALDISLGLLKRKRVIIVVAHGIYVRKFNIMLKAKPWLYKVPYNSTSIIEYMEGHRDSEKNIVCYNLSPKELKKTFRSNSETLSSE